MSSYASFSSTSTPALPSFIAGDFPRITRKITVKSGSDFPAGAVMGRVTADSKYTLSLSAASDGSQTPRVILSEPAYAAGGDVEVIAYLSGDYIAEGLTIGTGHTAASIADGLRGLGIYI